MADSFTVAPSPWLILWTALVWAALVCGAITAAKGRWGWFAVGLLFGFAWFFTAWLAAAPGSWWARRQEARLRTE